MICRTLSAALCLAAVAEYVALAQAVKAFPTAEGFGAYAAGGRGGRVIDVANLDDSGPGSLRHAMEAAGPRIVVFRVSGTITLKSAIRVRTPYLTVAGQTSPGGVQIKGSGQPEGDWGVWFVNGAHDIVIRHLRVRMGGNLKHDAGNNLLCYGTAEPGVHDVIFDHCSVSWGSDTQLDWYGSFLDRATFQWNLIAEGFMGQHIGGNRAPKNITIHHNLYANLGSRTPLMQHADVFDFRNNVIYNWSGNNASVFGQFALNSSAFGNVVDNLWLAGPEGGYPYLNVGNGGPVRVDGSAAEAGGTKLYLSGNWGPKSPEGSTNDWIRHGVNTWDYYELNHDGSTHLVNQAQYDAGKPFAAPAVTMDAVSNLLEKVLAGAGAGKPFRDPVDLRIIQSVHDGTGTSRGSTTGFWPDLALDAPAPPVDSDHDGIPDAWEQAHGLDPQNARDGAIFAANGYTHVENYLNGLAGDPIPGLGKKADAAAPREDAADRFYDPAVVQTIHLEIAPVDLDRMYRALPRRIYVPGTFRWNDRTLDQVGVRYRGNSSSAPDSPHKRSFLVAFSEFREGQRFLGLRHVALDNGIQFGGLFSERLITDVLRELGVKASRCNYARLYLNAKPAGVYVNVERIDRSFLERHFDSADGALFKADEGGPGADLRYQGRDPALYRQAFELHAGNEQAANAALVEFIRAIDTPRGTAADLRQNLDVEAFVKTTAVMLFAGAFDQYTGWGPHNYYLYRNPSDQRWTYLPWDLDVGFADRAFGRVPVLEGWHAAWPAPVPGRPLMERLVSDPELLQGYREQARLILETWFRPEVLLPKLRGLCAQIRPALAEDPYSARRVTVPSDAGFEDIVASMERFIRDRYTLARAQLDAPGNRPAPKSMLPGPEPEAPQPGPPSADAPSDLRVVQLTRTTVELHWVDHAEGEVAFVVQRCTGTECAEFRNAIGQGGQNLTTAMDREVQPGMTYRYRVYAVRPTPQGPRGTGVSNVVTVTVPDDRGHGP